MDKARELKDIPKYITPEIAERVAEHFKDGVFEFDLNTEGHIAIEGNTVYHVIPHFAEDGAESIVSKLRRIMARNLEETE